MEPLTARQPCDRRRWTRLPSHPCTPLSACCLTTPLEFKQQRICPLSLGFGTLGRSPSSSSPRQKTIAPRLHVCHFPRLPCALPCPAPPASAPVPETFRENSSKMSWKPCYLLCLQVADRKHARSLTSIGGKCTSSSTSCPRPLCTARNLHGNTERANKYQCNCHFNASPSQQVHIAIHHLLNCHPLFHVRHASHAYPAEL